MLVAGRQTFDPLAPLSSDYHEVEVLALAKSARFGQASYRYMCDTDHAWRAPREFSPIQRKAPPPSGVAL
jgi:hypothetical protein